MIYNSKRLAFALAVAVAFVSTVLLALLRHGSGFLILLTTFLTIFVTGFVIVYLALHKFVFGEIRSLQKRVENINPGIAANDHGQSGESSNPFYDIFHNVNSLITEKQSEIERLKKLEAFRKDFIADVSHELKTPIFAAQGFVHTLLDGAIKEKAVRKKFLRKAAKSLDALDMLVQDLLTLSQIETGQIKMRFGETDLYLLATDVLEDLRGKANKKDITLTIQGAARKVLVYADGQRIGQVLTNLVSNAIKHSDEGSEVVVTFTVRKKSVITAVKDTGEGIPAEHINRIFERFYRVDKSRSREKGGTGLGLAIVKHILDGHNTRAEVESEPGKGSTFSFKLPRLKTDNNGITEHHKPDEQ